MQVETVRGELIFLIHGFLTDEECRRLIADSEARRYEDAPISSGGGFVMRKEIRNNTRVISDDRVLADGLFARAQPLLPATWNGRHLAGLNERFRFYRYEPGQRFAPHYDGCFVRDDGERSELTFMVYLNEGFTGGSTIFYPPGSLRRSSSASQAAESDPDAEPPLEIRPRTGMALVFHHPQLHEGAVIEEGVKYVLRTDVMYAA